MIQPKVTVLIPAYNVERYVLETLKSVSSQTFRDFEILVIDDGSSDRTAEILAQHAACEPRLVVHRQANAGISAALNKGIELARGRYIARIDGDDLMLPDRLAKQVEFLDAHPDAGFCASCLDLIDAQGRVFGQHDYGPRDESELASFHDRGIPLVYTHPSVMLRTDAVRAAGGYDKAREPCEDMDLFCRLVRAGKPGYVLPERLIRYRVHGGSISAQKTERQVLMQELIKEEHLGLLPPGIRGLTDYVGLRARRPWFKRASEYLWLKAETRLRVARYRAAEGAWAWMLLNYAVASTLRPLAATRKAMSLMRLHV